MNPDAASGNQYAALLKILDEARAPVSFEERDVPEQLTEAILRVANAHTSINNLRPIEYVVTSGHGARQLMETLASASRPLGLRLPTDNVVFDRVKAVPHPLVVVIVADTRLKEALPPSVSRDSALDMIVGAVTQNIHLAAASLGLSCYWRPVRTEEESALRRVLAIPSHMAIKVLIEVGFASSRRAGDELRELKSLIHSGHYEEPKGLGNEEIRKLVQEKTRGFWKL